MQPSIPAWCYCRCQPIGVKQGSRTIGHLLYGSCYFLTVPKQGIIVPPYYYHVMTVVYVYRYFTGSYPSIDSIDQTKVIVFTVVYRPIIVVAIDTWSRNTWSVRAIPWR